VLTYEPDVIPAATNQQRLTRLAHKLATRMYQSAEWPSQVSNVYFITARGAPGCLLFTLEA